MEAKVVFITIRKQIRNLFRSLPIVGNLAILSKYLSNICGSCHEAVKAADFYLLIRSNSTAAAAAV